MANFQFRGQQVKNVNFLLTKVKIQEFFLVSDPFQKWFPSPEIENFPLMHLLRYKKFFVSGSLDR